MFWNRGHGSPLALTGHWVCTSVKWEESSSQCNCSPFESSAWRKKPFTYVFLNFFQKSWRFQGTSLTLGFDIIVNVIILFSVYITSTVYRISYICILCLNTLAQQFNNSERNFVASPGPFSIWNHAFWKLTQVYFFLSTYPDVFCFSSSHCWAEPTGQQCSSSDRSVLSFSSTLGRNYSVFHYCIRY